MTGRRGLGLGGCLRGRGRPLDILARSLLTRLDGALGQMLLHACH